MPQRLMSVVSAVLVLAWAPVASAQIWTAAGGTGAVDESDTSIYVFGSNGAVAIRSSVARGTLNLRYPVHPPDLLVPQEGDCPDLRVVLRDTGAGARVIVRLMELRTFLGSDQLTVLGEIDSDREPNTGGDPNQYRGYSKCLTPAPGSEFLFDLAFSTYYVDVQLIKTTASANPGLKALQICPSQDFCDP